MSDVPYNLDVLRGEVAELRAMVEDLRGGQPRDSDLDEGKMQMMRLRRDLKGDRKYGLATASIVSQIGKSHSGTAFGGITLDSADGLPSDTDIAEKVERLSRFVADPLIFRALRCLAEPLFDGQPMKRTKTELAARLGVGEDELEDALRPVIDGEELRWSKTGAGEESYEWTGNGMPMLMLMHG